MGALIYLYSIYTISGIIAFIGGIKSLSKKDDDKPALMFVIIGLGLAIFGIRKLTELL